MWKGLVSSRIPPVWTSPFTQIRVKNLVTLNVLFKVQSSLCCLSWLLACVDWQWLCLSCLLIDSDCPSCLSHLSGMCTITVALRCHSLVACAAVYIKWSGRLIPRLPGNEDPCTHHDESSSTKHIMCAWKWTWEQVLPGSWSPLKVAGPSFSHFLPYNSVVWGLCITWLV